MTGAIRRNSLSLLFPSAGERNYHIFYHMLAGASLDEKKQYNLLSSTSAYTYTKGTSFADGIDDAVEWTSVRHKLEVLGFTESDQQQMFRLFSAVLAIGNITFKPGAAADTHEVDGKDALALAAELLQVETAPLATKLTSKVISSGKGSSYTVPNSAEQCADARDALAGY